MLTKLLLTLAVVLAVLYGFRVFARLAAAKRRLNPPRARLPAEDLVKCPTCGTFVAAASPSRCDRSDCPYS